MILLTSERNDHVQFVGFIVYKFVNLQGADKLKASMRKIFLFTLRLLVSILPNVQLSLFNRSPLCSNEEAHS